MTTPDFNTSLSKKLSALYNDAAYFFYEQDSPEKSAAYSQLVEFIMVNEYTLRFLVVDVKSSAPLVIVPQPPTRATGAMRDGYTWSYEVSKL